MAPLRLYVWGSFPALRCGPVIRSLLPTEVGVGPGACSPIPILRLSSPRMWG